MSLNKEPTYSAEMFIYKLKKETGANQRAQIELIESQFYHSFKFLIPQLTFEVSSLFNPLKDDFIIFKTVSLESSDKDYEFIRLFLQIKLMLKTFITISFTCSGQSYEHSQARLPQKTITH